MTLHNARVLVVVVTVVAAVAAVTLCVARAQDATQTAPRPPDADGALSDVSWVMHFVVLQETPLATTGSCTVKAAVVLPSECRLEVTASEFEDALRAPAPIPGTQWLLHEGDLVVHSPMRGMTKLHLPDHKNDPLRISGLPSQLAPIGPYAYGLSRLMATDFGQAAEVEDLSSDEVSVLELRLAEPVKPIEPHRTAMYRWWKERERSVVTRSAAYDPEGTIVADTRHEEITEVAPGHWKALRTVCTVAPGFAHLRVEHEGEISETSIRMPGYVIETAFEWRDDHQIRLPTKRTYRDTDGATIATVEFSGYRINTGIEHLELRDWSAP